MQLKGVPIYREPKLTLNGDAERFINLYFSLGEGADNFVPHEIIHLLRNLVRICYEEADDPAKQLKEIEGNVNKLKEYIPGYNQVCLMLAPHEESKAFQYNSARNKFIDRFNYYIDTEQVNKEKKLQIKNIINMHDYSVGTPPVTENQLNLFYKTFLGDNVDDLRKFRDILGIKEYIEQSQWNYLLDVLDQMVIQSTHYTTKQEKAYFLKKAESIINFKGLNWFINTVVSGNSDTVYELVSKELFNREIVQDLIYENEDQLFETIKNNTLRNTGVFFIRIKSMTTNIFKDRKWFPYISRMILVDDSDKSRKTNTSLIFTFNNEIINVLNKVHSKKLGALANSQLNLRLILEKISPAYLMKIQLKIETKIDKYTKELKNSGIGDLVNDTEISKYNNFVRQILIDKYSLTSLRNYINFLIQLKDEKSFNKLFQELVNKYEKNSKQYFYSNGKKYIEAVTVPEGGGRNQIRLYGEYLLSRKRIPVDREVVEKCEAILSVIPNIYKRTLKNHFHNNFGINLDLEKYQEFLQKQNTEDTPEGNLQNFLIDLGIAEDFAKFETEKPKESKHVKAFLSELIRNKQTSISDDVQMAINDLLDTENLRPYILFADDAAWEYKDIFPPEKFDINPFDLEIGVKKKSGKVDYRRMLTKLENLKNDFGLFDGSGKLWDKFSENLILIVNDPNNPLGYSDIGSHGLSKFLTFINGTKITLFLDEAYNDSVKIDEPGNPKWKCISRYITDNYTSFSKLHFVSSQSTTKNLGATGNRAGVLTSMNVDGLSQFIQNKYKNKKGNLNSLYLLNLTLELSISAKKIKDLIEKELDKNAALNNIRSRICSFITDKIKNERNIKYSLFEGSPLHTFLLEELIRLDKLDIAGLPDNFLYKREPFFPYYQKELASALNIFRANRAFRTECNKRLRLAKNIARNIGLRMNDEDISDTEKDNKFENIRIVNSAGSYLFNIIIRDYVSFQHLEAFAKRLAVERGIAVLPYKIGNIRFSLGGYLNGNNESYNTFEKEFKNVLEIVLKHWKAYFNLIQIENKKEISKQKTPENILNKIFNTKADQENIISVLNDFNEIKNIEKQRKISTKINPNTLYSPSFAKSGISICRVPNSDNKVFEFAENIGECFELEDFVKSSAFRKVYENILPQVYKKISNIKLDISEVITRYGVSSILKYISNKREFQPNIHVLDQPDEKLIMQEILLETERILFSNSAMKIIALNASDKVFLDKERLEGKNGILKKFIKELFIQFDLPFENEGLTPTVNEITKKTCRIFSEITQLTIDTLSVEDYLNDYLKTIREGEGLSELKIYTDIIGYVDAEIRKFVLSKGTETSEKISKLLLLVNSKVFVPKLINYYERVNNLIEKNEDIEIQAIFREALLSAEISELKDILELIYCGGSAKTEQENIHESVSICASFIVDIANKTKSNEYYYKYTHSLIKITESFFKKQNSFQNEMFQHGVTVYQGNALSMKNGLDKYNKGELKWINHLMVNCGVIVSEQAIQMRTGISTDAKKREFPFHKVSSNERAFPKENFLIEKLKAKPGIKFFADRIREFAENADTSEYRCRTYDNGIVKQLFIYQKSFEKYLCDMFRLVKMPDVSLTEIESFVPDMICVFGAPSKLVSFPEIAVFDIEGPNGLIKTIVTPLEAKADYFGNIKKPWLTALNEVMKEKGFMPIHGSLFMVEREDGQVYVVQVNGDSGVGKSEMLAAMMLKWMKKDLTGIRSIKQIAGDMFHVIPDDKGNLYGIGTEIGDFSRTTDFDIEYIREYKTLFETSSDSNTEDKNARSTISGFCDISMPFKIDIILSASNYATEEAGIIPYDSPRNFVLFRDGHGERKEKATSQDGPSFQRTLSRYKEDFEIVEIIEKHGANLDSILTWDTDKKTDKTYIASTYKMIDKIDLTKTVDKIFKGKTIKSDKTEYEIIGVDYNIIENRFTANMVSKPDNDKTLKKNIDRKMFSQIFDSLASTPSGQPFITEEGQNEQKEHLINILKGGKTGTGFGKNIRFGILSTDLGREGKEISGPQTAVKTLIEYINQINMEKGYLNVKNQQKIIDEIYKCYSDIFNYGEQNQEINRYNYFLYQMENMRKAKFVKIDDEFQSVDVSKLLGFNPVPDKKVFCPLLVTPNINTELIKDKEVVDQLMVLSDTDVLAKEFENDFGKLYKADGYNNETVINNMIMQLLLLKGYVKIHDLTEGRILEKVDRKVIAVARYVVENYEKKTIVKPEGKVKK